MADAMHTISNRSLSKVDRSSTDHKAIAEEPRWYGFRYSIRTPSIILIHGLLFAAALLSAFLLAYNFRMGIVWPDGTRGWIVDLYVPLLALSLPVKLVAFLWLGQYRGTWRYVSLRDLYGVIRAALVGSFTLLICFFLIENLWDALYSIRLIDEGPSVHLRQSVFLLDWAATIVFVSGARIIVRFYYEDVQPQYARPAKRVLIVGAGDAGEALLRQLLRSRRDGVECVGLLDDQVAVLHHRIHNVEIIGRTAQIRELCQSHRVDEVLIASSQALPHEIRRMVELCEGLCVRFRTAPAITDVLEGRVQVNQIRDVDIADLLGRDPVTLDEERIGQELRGRRVVVTGAGGSIGSEMCRQISAFGPEVLVLIEQAENSLFAIDRELRSAYPSLPIVACIADVVDAHRVSAIFQQHRPQVVFHAAAHKHVPLMECNVCEAIKNNVQGTMRVAESAIKYGVRKMVMISTDKAVNPTSVMGCSKRIAELYVQSRNVEGGPQFVTVRFGNVLGSSGSVVPIFQEQIRRGGPVTVTHPDMKRYFMTIPEAAQLVLQAGAMGKGGEIFLLHMGEPVRVLDLAKDMITLSGLRPGADVEIVFTGMRPGEKLFEELSALGEHIGDTAHPKIGIWKFGPQDWDTLRSRVERLVEIAETGASESVREQMRLVVPEYAPASVSLAEAVV